MVTYVTHLNCIVFHKIDWGVWSATDLYRKSLALPSTQSITLSFNFSPVSNYPEVHLKALGKIQK